MAGKSQAPVIATLALTSTDLTYLPVSTFTDFCVFIRKLANLKFKILVLGVFRLDGLDFIRISQYPPLKTMLLIE